MKLYSRLQSLCVLGMATAAFALSSLTVFAADEYSFKLHNKTEQKIKQVLVSEDKKTWGKFDIGSGIGAGKTVTLVWDKSTNKESCKQWVKAVYADGEESKPAKFNFCEEDLEIEFEE
jgi:hypothetical protein